MARGAPARRKLRDLPGDPGAARASSEHAAQAQLVARIRTFRPEVLVFAVPNGGGRTTWEASRLKAEGVLAGVPDLLVAEPRGPHHGLFLEMKRRRGGRVSARQLEVGALLRERGYAVAVAEGVERGWLLVEQYLDPEGVLW